MCTSEQDFKHAIEDLCKERKYHLNYTTVGSDPQVCIRAHLRGGNSGRMAEVTLTGKGYTVVVPQTPVKKSFTKTQLNLVTEYIKDLLESVPGNE